MTQSDPTVAASPDSMPRAEHHPGAAASASHSESEARAADSRAARSRAVLLAGVSGAASLLLALIAAVLVADPVATLPRVMWFAILLLSGAAVAALAAAARSVSRWTRSEEAGAELARQRLEQERASGEEWRRSSDQAQQENESRFRLLVESISDYAVFMLDAHGRVMSWNAGAERIKGYTADEIIGRHFSVFYPMADQHSGRPAGVLRSALRDSRHEEDGWRVRKDGTQMWANVVIYPVMEDGELLGFTKVVRDLTQRHSSDVLLESILGSAIDGIIGVDENGIIRSFNEAAERIFRYEACAVIGSRFSALMPEPYRTNGIEYLSRFARAGNSRILGRGRQLVGLRS
ncbi:MAG TPA: PAS domain S-box protein, partial [Longimicrobiales bacterium]|nr:PAS domain S-box protein [Longimicrobiales bacterium]